MTVRVITLRLGAGDYYLNDLPSYYLDADEPRGRWLGIGADELGLAGELEDAEFRALMAGMDPRQSEWELGRPYTEKSVVGFDATASAPKSVSVLWALGDEHTRSHVLAAHDAAVKRWSAGSRITLTRGFASVVRSLSSTPRGSSPHRFGSTPAARSTRSCIRMW